MTRPVMCLKWENLIARNCYMSEEKVPESLTQFEDCEWNRGGLLQT